MADPSPLLLFTPEGAQLPSMRFFRNRAATDIHLVFEGSSDLRDWVPVAPEDPRMSVVGPEASGRGARILMEVAPAPGIARMYYRLRALKAGP